VAAKEMIHDTVEQPDLAHAEKALVLAATPRNSLGFKISSL